MESWRQTGHKSQTETVDRQTGGARERRGQTARMKRQTERETSRQVERDAEGDEWRKQETDKWRERGDEMLPKGTGVIVLKLKFSFTELTFL